MTPVASTKRQFAGLVIRVLPAQAPAKKKSIRGTPSYSVMLLPEKEVKHQSSPHRLQGPHLLDPKVLRKPWPLPLPF